MSEYLQKLMELGATKLDERHEQEILRDVETRVLPEILRREENERQLAALKRNEPAKGRSVHD